MGSGALNGSRPRFRGWVRVRATHFCVASVASIALLASIPSVPLEEADAAVRQANREDAGTNSGRLGKIAFVRGPDECVDSRCQKPVPIPDFQIWTMNPDGSQRRRILGSGKPGSRYDWGVWYSSPSWSPDGTRLVYTTKHCEYSGSFETRCVSTLQVALADGSNRRVIKRVSGGYATDLQDPSWSPDGTRIVYYSSTGDDEAGRQGGLEVTDATGANERVLTDEDSDRSPTWSPSGDWIAFETVQSGVDEDAPCLAPINIFKISPDGSDLTQVTHSSYSAREPSWSPDGASLAFVESDFCYRESAQEMSELLVVNEVTEDVHSLWKPTRGWFVDSPSWSPDGTRILFTKRDDYYDNSSIWSVTWDGSDLTRVSSNGEKHDSDPSVQPEPPPVIFVHGIDWQGASGGDSNWCKMRRALKNWGWTGPLVTVAYYEGDRLVGCQDGSAPDGFDIRMDDYPTSDEGRHGLHFGGDEEHGGEHEDRHDNDTDIRHLGYHWAWYVYETYTSEDIRIKAVGHSMGGLIIRYALSQMGKNPDFPEALLVDEVVTLGTPHGGTNWLRNLVCSGVDQCGQMGRKDPFIHSLKETANNPQATEGTEWTIIGSYRDPAINPDESAVNDDMDAAHRVMYDEAMKIDHSDYYLERMSTLDSKVNYLDFVSEWRRDESTECAKSPWPVRWVFLTLSKPGRVAPCG